MVQDMGGASIAEEEIRSPIRICSSYCGATSWPLGQPLVNRGDGEAVKWAAPRFCRPECDLELQGPENLGNPSGSKVSTLAAPDFPNTTFSHTLSPRQETKEPRRNGTKFDCAAAVRSTRILWSTWASGSPSPPILFPLLAPSSSASFQHHNHKHHAAEQTANNLLTYRTFTLTPPYLKSPTTSPSIKSTMSRREGIHVPAVRVANEKSLGITERCTPTSYSWTGDNRKR